MKSAPLCLPCLMQQAHRSMQLAIPDEARQCRFLQGVAQGIANTPLDGRSPAELCTPMYQELAAASGVEDPYAEVKSRQNQLGLLMLGHIEEAIRSHRDPLTAAARMAAAGNLIDNGLGVPEDLEQRLLAAIDKPFARDESPRFFQQLRSGAQRLLYICDNAGEIVFDTLFVRILKEHFPHLHITAAVKATPILNDATREDARQAGLEQAADLLITTGPVGMVGAPLRSAGEEFRSAMVQCDLFLSKGQGNYETLDDCPGGYLILTAKCPVVAQALGTAEGELVFVASRSEV